MTVFIRLLESSAEEKAAALRSAVFDLGVGEHSPLSFEQSPEQFSAIPGSPFAYWAARSVLKVFTTDEPFDTAPRVVVSTNPLNADFRFVRVWWEPSPSRLGSAWRPWAKGGAYSPHYYDVNTVIAWSDERQSYTGFLGTENRPLERPASVQHFFRPGLTWPRRTNGLSIRVMPAGCIFADKGPAAFVANDGPEELLALSAIMNSRIFGYLVSVQLARTELAQSYEVGIIQQTPVPNLSREACQTLARLARSAWSLRRSKDTTNETSHAFVLPLGLTDRITRLDEVVIERELAEIDAHIDDLAFSLYGISTEDRGQIAVPTSPDSHEQEADAGVDYSGDEPILGGSSEALNSWIVGVAFGRFDPRLATGERVVPPEPEPFVPLPSRSPGMYPEGEEPTDRPDILVDDEGHPDDLAVRARAIAERVNIDAPQNLRVWLAKDFFPLHLKLYWKSRRKAPIYWQLSTTSASYSVWLYIHAFSNDTLFRVQNDYVAPKLAHEERRLEAFTSELRDGGTAGQRKRLVAQESIVQELRTLLDEVKRAAPLWKPNLDDGVIINFAALWRLVPQNKSWQKELKSTWDALCEGKYDWAHLAMHLWPERVLPKCREDRSLAIAHGLEEVFWTHGEDGKWTARTTPVRTVNELVRERTSPAVKSALKNLLEAPVAIGAGKPAKRARRRRTSPETVS